MSKTDFVGDPAMSFLFLLKEAGALPAYVSQVPEEGDLKGLPSVAFADSENRQFPVHDKQSAFLSAVDAFVKGAEHSGNPWLARLKTACVAHGISADVQKAHDVLEVKTPAEGSTNEGERNDKQASAGFDTHALELCLTPGQPPTRFYPIANQTQIEMSAEKIASDIADRKLPPAWHSEACEKLIKSASRIGMDTSALPRVVVEYGRQFTPSRTVLEAELQKRAAAGLPEKYLEIYKEAAESALAGELDPNEGALVWQAADKKAGVSREFSGENDPLWAFKSGLPRDMADQIKEAHCLLGDVLIHKSALDRVSDREIAVRCSREDANLACHAKQASSGTEATRILGGLTPEGVAKVSELILETV